MPEAQAPSSDPPPFRPPKQTRSQQTLDRIADAALELMEEVGPQGATVADIVQRARASVGSFYARFKGKDDLIRYLRERVWTQARERWDESLAREDWSALPVASILEGVVGLLLQVLGADFRQRRVLATQPGEAEEQARLEDTFHQQVLTTVTPLVLARRGEITHPSPEEAVKLGYRFTVGAIREMLEERNTLYQQPLAPEIARAWTGYLCFSADVSGPSTQRDVDFFDPWS
jgi:AcrR family transcriptional regulator